MTRMNNPGHLRGYLLLLPGLCVLLAITIYCGFQVDHFAHRQQVLKQDYAALNSISFGIFSVDSWRDKISAVVDRQVNGYQVTAEQKKELEAAIEKQLHRLVTKTAAEINKPQKSLSGKLKKLAFNTIIDVDTLQKQVPPFAHAIVAKLTSPSSTRRLKGIVGSKLDQLEKQTYDSTAEAYHTLTTHLYHKYRATDIAQLNRILARQLFEVHRVSYRYAYAMFTCVLLALGLWWLLRKQAHLQTGLFLVSLSIAAVLLLVGITAPVIEVDARIGTLHFPLLGQQVGFGNQVLFFQSKSLLGIITTLINQSKPDAVTVGILIGLFVVLLPALMLIATGLHVSCGTAVANHRVVRYLAYEAGKWNMADVMVIGILMTYIGLNGIIKSQLSGLNMQGDGLQLATTNDSDLQPGYLVFVAYVVYETVLRQLLKKRRLH